MLVEITLSFFPALTASRTVIVTVFAQAIAGIRLNNSIAIHAQNNDFFFNILSLFIIPGTSGRVSIFSALQPLTYASICDVVP